MNIRRIMIAAPKSGSGKTIVTCALLQALRNRGEQVTSFKCGPDYIDPMFHEKVFGISAYNLDIYFTDEEQTGMLFAEHALEKETGYAVMEGVMGVYDGLGGIREEGSSYHLARITGTPIVLVADVKGMGRSILPFLAGFLQYDTEHMMKGVILNRISEGYYEILKPLVEEELHLPVLGFLPEREKYGIESRHLGLVMPDELKGMREKLKDISREAEETISIPAMMKIAESAGEVRRIYSLCGQKEAKKDDTESRPVIGVARDEAFCFYYRDNLRMLEKYGAEIKYFSPLHDGSIPEGCSGLLIGGGYPELCAEELEGNTAMRISVKKAVESGMPTVAECGGFMYLHEAIVDGEGICHEMAGVLRGRCFGTGRPVRFGYVEIWEKDSNFLPGGEKIKGHEFHYYDSTDPGSDALAKKPVTGKVYPCIVERENCWLGFPHLYYPSNPAFAEAFVEKARRYAVNCCTAFFGGLDSLPEV